MRVLRIFLYGGLYVTPAEYLMQTGIWDDRLSAGPSCRERAALRERTDLARVLEIFVSSDFYVMPAEHQRQTAPLLAGPSKSRWEVTRALPYVRRMGTSVGDYRV